MYVDTGLYAKLYLPEPESDNVQAVLAGRTDVTCSEMLCVEFSSVLARKVREKALSKAGMSRAWSLFQQQIAKRTVALLPVNSHILQEAADIVQTCSDVARVRSLDAVHLATCRFHGQFPLFTSDQVMLAAADHLGIPVRTLAGD